jgi:hypothetical protein
LNYDILTKLSKQDENSNLVRQAIVNNLSNTETILTGKNQDPISINQNISAYLTKNEKNVFALEVQHLYQNENPFYNANLQTQPFNLTGYLTGQNRNDLSQSRFVKTNKLDTKLDYYYMLTPKSNINITLGNTFSNQDFNSAIFQILDGGGVNNLASTQNTNAVNYKFNDAFLGLHYKMLSGKFTFTPGFSLHAYDMTNSQLGTSYNQNFFRILPDFLAIYQIKKAETLTYNFGYTNNFTDISKLAEGFVFNNYNSLSKGNRSLENAIQQTHSLRYFKYNMFNLENISANLSYSKTMNGVKTQSVFNGVNQSSSPYNSNFADESASAFAMYGRSFLKNYKASMNTRVSWSKFNNIQNGTFTSVESFTQTHTVSASTNYKNAPNLELGYSLTVNNYNQSKFYTDKPFVKLDYYFLKSFSFVSEYEFYHYYNGDKTVNNEYDFLSASLIYQKTKESKLEYKIAATNLLNTTSLNDDSFSQFSTRTSQYTVQPRYIIFSLKYNL